MKRNTYVGPLVVDLDLVAKCLKDGARLGPLICAGLGRRVPNGHALAKPRRRIGHAADDLAMAESACQRSSGRPGKDRQDQLTGPEHRGQLGPDAREHLRLDG